MLTAQREQKRITKEEQQQSESICCSSNDCNVDSCIVCASRGFINLPIGVFSRWLKGRRGARKNRLTTHSATVKAEKHSQ